MNQPKCKKNLNSSTDFFCNYIPTTTIRNSSPSCVSQKIQITPPLNGFLKHAQLDFSKDSLEQYIRSPDFDIS